MPESMTYSDNESQKEQHESFTEEYEESHPKTESISSSDYYQSVVGNRHRRGGSAFYQVEDFCKRKMTQDTYAAFNRPGSQQSKY